MRLIINKPRKTNRLSVILLVICGLLYSCVKNEKYIDLENGLKEEYFSNYFELDTTYILPTNLEFPLDVKIIKTPEHFIFADINYNNSVTIVDKNLNIINEFSPGIGGPSEYTSLTALCTDNANQEIYIYSLDQSKVFVYSFGGKFINEYKIPNSIYVHDIAYIPENKLLVYAQKDKSEDKRLNIINLTTGAIQASYLKGRFRNILVSNDNILENDNNGNIYIAERFENHFYSINNSLELDSISILGTSDFTDLYTTPSLSDFKKKNENQIYTTYMDMFNRSDKITSFMYGNSKEQNTFISIHPNKLEPNINLINPIYDLCEIEMGLIKEIYEDQLITYIPLEALYLLDAEKIEKFVTKNNKEMNEIEFDDLDFSILNVYKLKQD